jgi:hypothetical protein
MDNVLIRNEKKKTKKLGKQKKKATKKTKPRTT